MKEIKTINPYGDGDSEYERIIAIENLIQDGWKVECVYGGDRPKVVLSRGE